MPPYGPGYSGYCCKKNRKKYGKIVDDRMINLGQFGVELMELVMFKVGIASEYNVLAGILYEKIGKNMRKLQVIEYIECGRHFECEAIP